MTKFFKISDVSIKLTKEKLSVEEAYNFVLSPSSGGISIFVGTTRDNSEGKTVVKLEYESYEEMAIKELEKICRKIKQKWPINKIYIAHRLGEVLTEEGGVVISCSAAHRKEALSATEFCINQLKERVPIWKKEIYDNGESEWKESCNHSPHPQPLLPPTLTQL